jgi:hypothetical protein
MTAPSVPQSPAGEVPAGGVDQTPPAQSGGGCLGCVGLIVIIAIGLAIFNGIQSCTAQASRPAVTTTFSTPGMGNNPGGSQPGDSDSTPTITKSRLFSSGVVDILNAFDEGDQGTKLIICRDVSRVLNGMSSTEMQKGLDSMSAYDASVLQDLAADCNRLA